VTTTKTVQRGHCQARPRTPRPDSHGHPWTGDTQQAPASKRPGPAQKRRSALSATTARPVPLRVALPGALAGVAGALSDRPRPGAHPGPVVLRGQLHRDPVAQGRLLLSASDALSQLPRRPRRGSRATRRGWSATNVGASGGRGGVRAADRQREARHAQQLYQAWREAHGEDLAAQRAVTRELAWQTRVAATAAELDRPAWAAELGEPPISLRGRRAYRHATRLLSDDRDRYQVTDPDRALGPEPRGGDLEQRRAHRACQEAIERVQGKQRAERDRTDRAAPDARDGQRPAQQAHRARPHQHDRAGRGGRERDAS
jgi:hypothetical protein